jgi:hypothetical protein
MRISGWCSVLQRRAYSVRMLAQETLCVGRRERRSLSTAQYGSGLGR